jgi:divalent metal cation (Fe/Co/Zn/Cd) transporter
MRVEILTLVWMVLEAIVAIGSGLAAGSALLIAFGLDSLIELASAGLLLWRLGSESKSGNLARVEQIEQRATWVSRGLLTLLCLYVLAGIVIGLIWRIEPEASFGGIVVSIGALTAMPLLAVAKRRINVGLDSPSLRADIAESVTCAYMAGTVLVGLAFNAILGWWWAEYFAAAVFLYWLISETREAFEATRAEPEA